MDPDFLSSLGMIPSHASAYLSLIENGPQTPPQLAKKIGESRTNTYMILDKLADMGLTKKLGDSQKLTYMALNPSNLEEMIKDQRLEISRREEQVRQAMPELLSFFYTYSEQPGIKFYQGREGILEIYDDILRTGKTLFLVRGVSNIQFIGRERLDAFIEDRVKKGIKVKALTPKTANSVEDENRDKRWLMDRTWVDTDYYNEPVEINIYGDKTAFTSFGNEALGVIIESPQIAAAMKRIFKLSQLGARFAGLKKAVKHSRIA